jgi:hypothetical protein
MAGRDSKTGMSFEGAKEMTSHHPLKRRLAARKSIALLTGSHASLGLANRMVGFEGYQTKTAGDFFYDENRRYFPIKDRKV